MIIDRLLDDYNHQRAQLFKIALFLDIIILVSFRINSSMDLAGDEDKYLWNQLRHEIRFMSR